MTERSLARRFAAAAPRTLPDSHRVVVAAPGARLASVGGVALLFVPGREGLFEADSFVAALWPRLRAGLSVKALLAAARSAQRDGAELLRDLLGAGAVEHVGTGKDPVPVVSRIGIDLGSLRLGINFAGEGDFGALRGMLAHLELSDPCCDRHLLVLGTSRRVGIGANGAEPRWVSWSQAAPTLKATLTDIALEALAGVALHVATLSDGDEALLLVGDPGAGKSTLAVALGAAGFRVDGDDVAALEPDGSVKALPFPATVKDGAWSALAASRPDLAKCPAALRPDGQSVRYLPLDPGAPPPRRVRAVLCLDRTSRGPTGLSPLGVPEAIGALLAGAWSADRKLAPKDFDALMACVGAADVYRMTYGTLHEALPLCRRAWQMAGAAPAELAR